MDIRRLIHKRIRYESPNTSVAADVNAVVAVNVGTNRQAKTDKNPEGSMEHSEERRTSDAAHAKRVEEVRQNKPGRAAPIDEDVVGELNAALPEDEPASGSDAAGGSRAA